MMKYKMKKYIATLSSAKKKAREISEQTIYGTMVLRSIVRKEG